MGPQGGLCAVSTNRVYIPQIVAVEGLDGVGKSTIARVLTDITGGVNVTKLVAESMGISRHTIVNSNSIDARFHYWVAVNYLAGEYASKCVEAKQVAVIDSYFFRTIASHSALGMRINSNPLLSKAVRPDRAVLLTAPEEVRAARLQGRDGDAKGAIWHTDLAERWPQVLGFYRNFDLTEIDTTGTPYNVAKQILESETAQNFRFGI
jgi:thymidylate kinase